MMEVGPNMSVSIPIVLMSKRQLLFVGSIFCALFAMVPAQSGARQEKVRQFNLRAVLVVGPQEDGTESAIEKMDKIATLLEKSGIDVAKFYHRNTNWGSITDATRGADLFIYSGHGSNQGFGGNVGGLCVTSIIDANRISRELNLHRNALVLFQSVCNGAGSSAGDNGDIGLAVAMKRVSEYARPFFMAGAGCYYANNMTDGCLHFLTGFLAGKSVKTCFEETVKTWAKIETVQPYMYDSLKQIGMASICWNGSVTRIIYENGVKRTETVPSAKNYDIAFVAEPGYSIDCIVMNKKNPAGKSK